MKSTRLCFACGNLFHPFLQVPNQRYCSAPAWSAGAPATLAATASSRRCRQSRQPGTGAVELARPPPGLLASIPRDPPGLSGAQLRNATETECPTKFKTGCKHGRVTAFPFVTFLSVCAGSCRTQSIRNTFFVRQNEKRATSFYGHCRKWDATVTSVSYDGVSGESVSFKPLSQRLAGVPPRWARGRAATRTLANRSKAARNNHGSFRHGNEPTNK
jgi:hypothetical protein